MARKTNVTRLQDHGEVAAGDLHLYLAPTATLTRSFNSEKELQRFRRLVYSINKQDTYRYRTMRSEGSMWELVIWRMR